jgi:predicted XRE-type DNA-binding protein
MPVPIAHDDPIYQLRLQLAAEITRSLGGGQSQFVVAPSYGISQPRMSEISRGIVDRCTVEWLVRRVYRLGGTVGVRITLGDAHREWVAARLRRSRLRRAAP